MGRNKLCKLMVILLSLLIMQPLVQLGRPAMPVRKTSSSPALQPISKTEAEIPSHIPFYINQETLKSLKEKLGDYGNQIENYLLGEMGEKGYLELQPFDVDEESIPKIDFQSLPKDYTPGRPFIFDSKGRFVMYLDEYQQLMSETDNTTIYRDIVGGEDIKMYTTDGLSGSGKEGNRAGFSPININGTEITENDTVLLFPNRVRLRCSVESIDFPAMELGKKTDFSEEEVLKKLQKSKKNFSLEIHEPFAYASFQIWYEMEIGAGKGAKISTEGFPEDIGFPFEIQVNYSTDEEDFADPYPKASYPWIEVFPGKGIIRGSEKKTIVVKVNTTGLEPGSYLAHLVIKPPSNFSLYKPAATFLADVERKVAVRITVWPSKEENHSVRFEVLGYGEGIQLCDVGEVNVILRPMLKERSPGIQGWRQISIFSLLIKLKDYGTKKDGSIFWIHSYSMYTFKVVKPDRRYGVKVSCMRRPYASNRVFPIPSFGNVSHKGSIVRLVIEAYGGVDIHGDKKTPEIYVPIHIFYEGKEVVYRFRIRYQPRGPFWKPSLPSLKITPLPSLGGPKVVRQGEKAVFGFVCWNPCVPDVILLPEPKDYEHVYCRFAVANGAAIKAQMLSYVLITRSLMVEMDSPYLMGTRYARGFAFPDRGTLMPGGTPGGEAVIYTILSGKHLVAVGDKPGRMFHLLVVDTSHLEPGNYICPVGYLAVFNIQLKVKGGGIPKVWPGEGINWSKFKELKFGVAMLNTMAIGFNLTVLPKDVEPCSYKGVVTPRSYDMESSDLYKGKGINKRLNVKIFRIEGNGKGGDGSNKPLIHIPQGNLYKSYGRPPFIGGYLSAGHIIVGDRSSMFDLYPKRPVEIWNGLMGNESVAIPRIENGFPDFFSGLYDPGLERWRTPVIYRLYHTLGLINYHVIRLNPPPPFETLKLRILDPVSGEWPDEIPPTYHWTGQGSSIPPINEKDALGWLHRRYPRYGKWVSRLEGVTNHSKVRMKLEIDLEQFGQSYGLCGDIGPHVHPPFLLKCTLPGIEICGIESRFGAWYRMHSPTADRSVCRFSWTSSSDCLEGSLTVDNEGLKIYIPRGWLAPIPPPWAASKSKPVSYLIPATGGRKDFKVPVGGGKWMTFPGPPYYPNFPLARGVSDITTLSITFNGTIKKVGPELICEASLILPVNEKNPYGRGNLSLQVPNWSEEVEDREDWIRVGKSDVRISVRESNQPPRVELLYPKDHQTDLSIMLEQLAVRVYDPDGDKLSVSFYWASKDCIQIEPEEKKFYFTRSERGVHPSAMFPYSYEWMTKRYLIQTKYNVASGSVVMIDPRPVVYKFLGREWGHHKSITDAVIKGLEFGKEYQWYVVVRDRSTEIKSPIYHFRTANSKPDVRIRVFPERPVITNNTALWVYYKPFLLKNVGTLYEPVTKWFNRSVWVHLSIDTYDPEGLIRCVDHWRMKIPSWHYKGRVCSILTPSIIGRDSSLPLPYRFELADKGVLALFTKPGMYTVRCSVYYDRYDDAYVPSTWKGYKLCDPETSFSILDGNHNISADFNCSTLKPKVGEQIVLDGSPSNISGDIVEHRWFKIVYRIEAEFYPETYTYSCKPERYARSIGKGEILSYEWDEPPGVQHLPAVGKRINYFQIVHIVKNHAGTGTSLTKQVYPEEAKQSEEENRTVERKEDVTKVVNNTSQNPEINHGEEGKVNQEMDQQVTSRNAEVDIMQPLENMLYFRNRPICRFLLTLVIGPIDVKIRTNGTFSQLKIFVDGIERVNLSYQEGKNVYTYKLDERGISRKTIRAVLYGNGGEAIEEKSVSFFSINLGIGRS